MRMYDTRPGEVVVVAVKRTIIGDPRLNYTPMMNMGWPVVENERTILPSRLFLKLNPRVEGERMVERGDLVIVDAERGVVSVPFDVGDHRAKSEFLNQIREEVVGHAGEQQR